MIFFVRVKQSNNFSNKQAFPSSVSQPNKAKPDSQSVNTNDPDYLDCLTVDRPGAIDPIISRLDAKYRAQVVRDPYPEMTAARHTFLTRAIMRR